MLSTSGGISDAVRTPKPTIADIERVSGHRSPRRLNRIAATAYAPAAGLSSSSGNQYGPISPM